MERQNNGIFTDLQKSDLQKLQHAVTNFCKSVKWLYIKELSAKTCKMSKMSAVLKSYTCVCAHTRVYTRVHTHTSCARKLLTFLHFDIFRVYFIDFQCFNRLAKIAFLIFHFCKSCFLTFQTFILDMGKLITLTGWKTEYLAFEGTERFLGINPLAGWIESRSG